MRRALNHGANYQDAFSIRNSINIARSKVFPLFSHFSALFNAALKIHIGRYFVSDVYNNGAIFTNFLCFASKIVPKVDQRLLNDADFCESEQCDQMGLFSKILVTNYFSNVAHMFGDFWDILKISLFKGKLL